MHIDIAGGAGATMDLLFADFLGTPIWMWTAFMAVVAALLAFDLGVLHRDNHVIGVAESLMLSAGYIAMGLLFGAWIWTHLGDDAGLEYLTAFVVEKSLAMDNVFVIAMIFGYFAVPQQFQHRVLFWGILGVILLRAVMIGVGAALVAEFAWVLYVFAVFLVFTGIKMFLMADKTYDVGANPLIGLIRRVFNVTDEPQGDRFFVRQRDTMGKMVLFATPLFLALVLIEVADVIFAVDSVPAVFAITTDPYIVYTSNIFAILGLRALYFALAAIIHRFHYLKYALSALLIFIGAKIFVADLLALEKFPPMWSLSVTFAILGIGVVYSLLRTRAESAS